MILTESAHAEVSLALIRDCCQSDLATTQKGRRKDAIICLGEVYWGGAVSEQKANFQSAMVRVAHFHEVPRFVARGFN